MKALKILGVRCPKCRSDVLYRYGKSKTGKQRYQCMICGMQFVIDLKKHRTIKPPTCPACGRKMHLYKMENQAMRFRCSYYPVCKNYLKVAKGGS